ncbi:MAG: hypothetical protein HWN79_00725 [Candidatus Lokiarchaeota archaeon]|nr:hypothetical protein [Candidatus Lokiarchaeota archaeon]
MNEQIFSILNNVGTLNESSLHSALKLWCKRSEDQLEVPIENFVIDIVRDDLLIEIQTKNFSTIRKKLESLLKNHRVLLIHPIVKDKWIISIDQQSYRIIRKRLSPRHELYLDIFEELIRIPDLISNPNLTIELLLVQTEEFWINDGKGSWRRKGWSIYDKRLVNVLERKVFCSPIDFLMLKPSKLKPPFTNAELAYSLERPLRLAQKMSYCLRKMGIIKVVGKRGRALLFDY